MCFLCTLCDSPPPQLIPLFMPPPCSLLWMLACPSERLKNISWAGKRLHFHSLTLTQWVIGQSSPKALGQGQSCLGLTDGLQPWWASREWAVSQQHWSDHRDHLTHSSPSPSTKLPFGPWLCYYTSNNEQTHLSSACICLGICKSLFLASFLLPESETMKGL